MSDPSPPFPPSPLRFHNVTASCKIASGDMNLRDISVSLHNTFYKKKGGHVQIVLKEPRCTCMVYKSGSLAVSGAASEEDARRGARVCARKIQKLGHPVHFRDFKITGMMGAFSTGFKVKLEHFAGRHSHECSYEPELFPAAIYRMPQPDMVFQITVDGNVTISGSTSSSDMRVGSEKLAEMLANHKKTVE